MVTKAATTYSTTDERHSPPDIGPYFEILIDLIDARIKATFAGMREASLFFLPVFGDDHDPLTNYAKVNELGVEELYTLLIALAPHVRPELFDMAIQNALPQSEDFPLIGGVRGKQFRGFLPTAETVLFLLAGDDWHHRQQMFHKLFNPEHPFAKRKIIWLDAPPDGEPLISGKLMLNPSLITLFTTGKEDLPVYSLNFPAHHITTKLEWNDVVLSHHTQQELNDIRSWFTYSPTLMKDMGMDRKFVPGYRALFFGPPGTGKTLSAMLLGKEFKKPVFRIDLSNLVSKFIGETEKNLARLLDEAEYRNWILFFDEADAIFGKRTQVKDAHDRYANQEVSYLMQRIESYDGLIILASNLKGNIDEAFTRRFQSMVFFSYPTPEEQLTMWERAFPPQLRPNGVDLRQLAKSYRLSGANIVNIAHYCCLTSLADGENSVSGELIAHAIQRELLKEGRTA
ncbi:MAG: ATP-binding protein [Bacteroidota bacterium]